MVRKMKGFLVFATLIGIVWSNDTLNNQCHTDECSNSSDIDLNDGSVIIKSKLNDSSAVNKTSKKLHYLTVDGDVGNSTIDSNEEDALLRKLSEKLTSMTSTPFNPAHSSSKISPKCKIHSKMFMDAFKNFDVWAVKMHDSTAKISSGVLNGNVNYFGDFDQCLSIQGPIDDVKGKYCLTYLQASIPENMPKLRHLHNLMRSHNAFISEFDDPGHRVPRFSMLNYAVCVPSSCTAMDVENSLKEYIRNFTKGTKIHVQVRVDSHMCQVKDKEPYDESTKKAALFFLIVIMVSLVSTIVDYKFDNPNPWFVAFSIRKNLKSIFTLERAPNDIESIHGLRFANAFLLLFSHKSMAIFFNPYINRTQLTEALGQPWTVLGRAAAIYTDIFLMFSGLLTSYAIIGRLQKKQSPRLLQEYVGRFIRIVPTLGALILFCTFILPHLDSGPQWNLVVTRHAGICKQHWWRNLLFIHNYFGFENMCLTHTHHLGIDTELFVVAPVLILILWKWPKKGAIFLLTIAGISTVARFNVTVTEKLSNYVYFGTSIKRLFKTADYMYSLPFHRCTIYIIGILLGYALRVFKDIKLTKTQIKVGWYVSITLFLLVLIGPAPMGCVNYVYNEYHAAVYAALGPMAWCGLGAWVVFTSHLGYSSIPSRIFSWPGFLVTTRLSYAIYLTQFPIFFFNVGRTRHAGYFSFLSYTLNLNENIAIILASIALTVFFDTPFQNIKKIIFSSSTKPIRDSPVNLKKLEKTNEIVYAKEIKFE